MSDHAFLRTIRESPSDPMPQLIYADWLEQQGESSRAELIRVVDGLKNTPEWLPAELRDVRAASLILNPPEVERLDFDNYYGSNRYEHIFSRQTANATVPPEERLQPGERITLKNAARDTVFIVERVQIEIGWRDAPTQRLDLVVDHGFHGPPNPKHQSLTERRDELRTLIAAAYNHPNVGWDGAFIFQAHDVSYLSIRELHRLWAEQPIESLDVEGWTKGSLPDDPSTAMPFLKRMSVTADFVLGESAADKIRGLFTHPVNVSVLMCATVSREDIFTDNTAEMLETAARLGVISRQTLMGRAGL